MAANRRRDTGPERTVRSLLHRSGLRFRVDFPIPVEGNRPIRADVVFRRQRVALFIDGCFWHGCPEHGTQPKANSAYWGPKIRENQERDARHHRLLSQAGWTVLRAWTHEEPAVVVERIRSALSTASESVHGHSFRRP